MKTRCEHLLYLLGKKLEVCIVKTVDRKQPQRHEAEALGDPNMRCLQKGDIIQLERRGYFIVDVPLIKPGKQPMVLFEIPDGRVSKVNAAGKK